jgi:hypothetical protein
VVHTAPSGPKYPGPHLQSVLCVLSATENELLGHGCMLRLKQKLSCGHIAQTPLSSPFAIDSVWNNSAPMVNIILRFGCVKHVGMCTIRL